ncbi:glycosyltransferase [Cytobacillus sp. Hz8]|uniref:glycosyltransferase n=1 Tax=Cytobacillus sp. Hz8 TaxID=3347168 RepID=UPI0035DCA33A
MNPLVSINCATYNHENFIRDAIEGFLMQKTNFDFEILIGEDCSTDNTRTIVEKYANQYPGKIRVITSEHNVGAIENFLRLHQNSRGKYIAICEGDDYWIDQFKLQKQVDYMESHPECTFCFHNGKVVDANKNQTRSSVIPWMKNNEEFYYKMDIKYSAGELALLGYIPTASYLYPKRILENPPNWSFKSVVGDNVIKLIASSHGYAYYIDEKMCAYRFGVEGSATTNWEKENNTIEKKIEHYNGFINLYNNFNDYSENKYKDEIDRVKMIFEFQIFLVRGDWKIIREKKYSEIFYEMSIEGKIKTFMRCFFPNVYSKMSYLKSKLIL